MNERMIVALAAGRGRNLDQPDLAGHATAHSAWETWTPIEGLVELPAEAEELIDAASAELGHLADGCRRRHAWRCAEAAAWGRARPLPQLPDRFHRTAARPGLRRALAALWQRHRRT
jgi:hypothetical protein